MLLRQSTASQTDLLGPYVDDTDGATPETGLTIANTDIRLSKNGGNLAAKNSGGGTHDENGWYTVTFDATDTDTVGRLKVHSKVTGALMVHAEYQVIEEAIYDALFAASADGLLPANVTQISGDATAADNLEAEYDGTGYKSYLRRGTAQAGGASSITLDAGASATDNLYNGLRVRIISGTGAGQSRVILGYVGSTKVATVTPAWTTNPASGSVFVLTPGHVNVAAWRLSQPNTLASGRVGANVTAWNGTALSTTNPLPNAAPAASGGLPTVDASNLVAGLQTAGVNAVADQVWDEALAGHLGAGSTGEALNAAGAAGDPWTTALPGAYGAGSAGFIVGNNLDASVGDVEADIAVVQTTVDDIETDTQDIQSRLPAALVGGRIDANMGAISGSAAAADAMEAAAIGIVTGTAVTGTLSTTQMSTDLTETTDDHYIGRYLVFTGGALAGQATDITDYDGTGKILTFTALTEAPSNTDPWVIL